MGASLTRTPQEAVDYAKSFLKEMPFERVSDQIAQDVSNEIWASAPWWWSIGTLAAITLVEGQQTHVVSSPPSDFNRFEKAYISDSKTLRSLVGVSLVPAGATLLGLPNFVAYMDSDQSVSPAEIWFEKKFQAGGKTWKFWAWYKKTAPILTTDMNTPGALQMPDDYYQVYREGVLYYALKWATDPRAGGAQVEVARDGNRGITYTGQLGVYRAAIEELRRQETVIEDFPDETAIPLKTN